jgi:O-antigen/teichoic acid export membrane protein
LKIKSLNHNFIMYSIRMISNIGFSIIILPLVIKKIGPEYLGKFQYAEAIVGYFLLLINLGIDIYGKREVALERNNKEKLSQIISELLIILSITTFFGVIFYIVFVYFSIKDIILKRILMICTFNIIFNFIRVEWFYVGVENQEYITKRNLIIKILSAIFIVIFIKGKNDIYIYTMIMVFSLVGSNFWNFFYLRKFIELKNRIKLSREVMKKHIKNLWILSSGIIAANILCNMDSIMIKNIIGDIELGYYSFAIKFGKLPLIFASSIVAIFYPRLCNLLGQGKKEEYYKLTTLGVETILLFSFPTSIGMIILSDIVVKVFAGIEFLPSIQIIKVFSIYILVMGIALCTGSITLIANKKDKVYSLSVVVGSILNFFFNMIFISKIGALGAAIATLITETTAIILRIVFCRDIFKNIKVININLLKIIIASVFMGVIVNFSKTISSNMVINLLISIGIGGISYFTFLLISKEKNTILLLNKIKIYVIKKNK